MTLLTPDEYRWGMVLATGLQPDREIEIHSDETGTEIYMLLNGIRIGPLEDAENAETFGAKIGESYPQLRRDDPVLPQRLSLATTLTRSSRELAKLEGMLQHQDIPIGIALVQSQYHALIQVILGTATSMEILRATKGKHLG